jgi:EAL domain-containing protein (putative c-di-GMP-specific phosphodiesterase class I)
VIAERVRESLEAPFELGGTETFITGSIGVAVGRGTDVGPDELLRDADVAMYVAKAKGKGRSETFDPRMHQDVQDRLVLEADLRRAITHEEFVVHYQPVWATCDRRVVGVEALVRWRHPTRGLLGPVEFIALAEETGLIVPIGGMVLREACRQVSAWDRSGGLGAGLTVAVNLSPRQLREGDLVATVASALADAHLPARRLNLEITEAVLVDDSPATAELLGRLKALGVRISIDDFGTGYSSLSYLRRLPIDTLKIAKPFVDVVVGGAKDGALAQAIVSLARSLQLQVVAEGIEEQAQLDALIGMGCELGQGFLVSPPVTADLLPALARMRGDHAA